jgi:hypothetical protein
MLTGMTLDGLAILNHTSAFVRLPCAKVSAAHLPPRPNLGNRADEQVRRQASDKRRPPADDTHRTRPPAGLLNGLRSQALA